MKLLSIPAVIIAGIAYPVIVYLGVQHDRLSLVIGVVILAMVIKLMTLKDNTVLRQQTLFVSIAGIMLMLCAYWADSAVLVKCYPVVVNLVLLSLFIISLHRNQPVITQLAMSADADLDEAGFVYTRQVTVIWCWFFTVNTIVSLSTLFMSNQAWVIYNSLISYCLIASLLIGELVYRKVMT